MVDRQMDTYRHLSDNPDDGVKVVVGVEEFAKKAVAMNYGVHRLLSAIVRARREDNLKVSQEKDDQWYLKDPLADGIEALLNKGLY